MILRGKNMSEEIHKPWLDYYPEGVPKSIDYEVISLGEMFEKTVNEFPDSQAIVFEGWRCTYRELKELVDKFAVGLANLGVEKGDVVAIDLPNIPQFIIAYYATVKLGAIVNPIIPLHKFVEIAYQVNDSNSKVLIILDALYEGYLMGKDLSKMEPVEHIILTGIAEFLPSIKGFLGKLLGKVPHMKEKLWPEKDGDINVHKFQEMIEKSNPADLPDVEINPKEDIGTLIYTGGTTGVPKGVKLSHFNLLANAQQGTEWLYNQVPKTRESRGKGGSGCLIPFGHVFGLSTGMNLAVSAGYKLILYPSPPEKRSDVLKLLMKENGVYIPAVPTLYNQINQDPDSENYKGKLNSLVACLSGGSSLPPEVKRKFEDLTGALIIEGYGASETAPIVTAGPFHRYKIGSPGVPVSDTLIKIMDVEEGSKMLPICPHKNCDECDPEESEKYIGELCVHGPQVMLGYLNKPKATERALRKDSKGRIWYYTSDISCIDAEGYLHIKDRKRDMIKYKGHGVFPAEVENLIYQNPAVNEVGVIGAPHPDGVGETIKAFISIKPEYKDKISEEEMLEWCKENISPYKYPRQIQFIEELPKTLVGKIKRRELREE
ncbi:MAG: AMP-binding protein [Candidatus Lokiarchaeota archaeon]|nr:AMP-binding protein [Candidatus Lokiarchaeota archaeon]MBD3199612.1 AMP-binding protein [Candidatus Lokiarchaeota archaeon]